MRTIVAACGGLGALALLGGCPETTSEPWSTKSQSVLTAHEVGPELRHSALNLLEEAAVSDDPLLRANAVEAMHYAPLHLEPLVTRGLVDENRGVRFVAAMTIGEFQMTSLAHLLEPLLRDESLSVQAAALYGLERCGRTVDLTRLASMIASDDPEVRGNAAMILGELGNPSAAPMIRRAVGRGMSRVSAARIKVVDLQMAEAMVKLGDEHEIEVIRAALFSPGEQGEIAALACMMCGRLRDERVAPNLIRLARRTGQFQQSAEVRMAATWALAQIEPAQATLEVPLSYVRNEQFTLRAQAALTLGQIGDPAVVGTLTRLLEDPSPMVQVAAAGALLQIDQIDAR